MTNSDHSDRHNLKFFLSTPSTCGYLPDRESVSLFADPKFPFSPAVYDLLIDHGFRRSADYVYRPHCPECNLCVPARVPVDMFKKSRSQKRIWNKNSDLEVHSVNLEPNQEHYALYQKYQRMRHGEGEMANHDIERYSEFLESEWCETLLLEFRHEGRLVAVAVTDVIRRGLSAFYTYFDPDYADRSLGTYAVLWQIELTQKLGLPWLYLGYWIHNCQKMNYKTNFRPLEMRIDEQWELFKLNPNDVI